MRMDDLPFLSIKEASSAIIDGRISPVDLVEAVMDRIRRLNDLLNAYVSVYYEEAVEEAKRVESEIRSGKIRSVLHGIPISLKDVFHIKGKRTTASSKLLVNYVADRDADVVKSLKESGAIIIGKTNLHEFAYGATNTTSYFGPSRNPWDTNRMSGGSSGGSASAVASGMCMASLGTDTGGSVRIPASLCGVVGLKPTYGVLSMDGVIPLAWSMDHIGILTRTVWDAAAVLDVLCKPSKDTKSTLDILSKSIDRGTSRRFSVGIPPDDYIEPLDNSVREKFWESLRKMEDNGWIIRRLNFKHFQELGICRYIILLSEAASFHSEWFKQKASDYSEELRRRIMLGMLLPADIYIKAQRARSILIEEFLRSMKGLDIVACPTTSITAPSIDAKDVTINDKRMSVRVALLRLTEPFNALGFPAISIPCGISKDGLPIGLQLVARPYEESLLLSAAMELERIEGFGYRRPPI